MHGRKLEVIFAMIMAESCPVVQLMRGVICDKLDELEGRRKGELTMDIFKAW